MNRMLKRGLCSKDLTAKFARVSQVHKEINTYLNDLLCELRDFLVFSAVKLPTQILM